MNRQERRAARSTAPKTKIEMLRLEIGAPKLSYGLGLEPPDQLGMCQSSENFHIEASCGIVEPAEARGRKILTRIRGNRTMQTLIAEDASMGAELGAYLTNMGQKEMYLQVPQDQIPAIYAAMKDGSFKYIEITMTKVEEVSLVIAYDFNVELNPNRGLVEATRGGRAH